LPQASGTDSPDACRCLSAPITVLTIERAFRASLPFHHRCVPAAPRRRTAACWQFDGATGYFATLPRSGDAVPRQQILAPSRQRVVACVGGERTRVEERPTPAPGPGELLLATRAVGLCGTDLFKLATGRAAPGLVLGHELVGTVVVAGDGTPDFEPGDRVAVPHHVPCGHCAQCLRGSDTLCPRFRDNLLEPGGFADYVLVRARAVRGAARKVPDWMTDDTAVWMEPAACVLRGIWRAGLPDDGLMVVQGAGSMGLLHLLVMKAERPGCRVVVVDPLQARRRLATGLGADACATPADAVRTVREASSGLGADAVFDTVGGAAPMDAALALCREGGTVVLFAHAAEGERAGFDINTLFKFERRLVGSYSGGPREQARVFELMCRQRLDAAALVSHHLDLAAFQEGVELARRRVAMKVVFVGAGTHG
jgi:L-iditol 2-dehydrogenase